MTEQTLLPPPDETSEPTATQSAPAARSRGPWLYGAGFVLLSCAIVYVWQHPATPGGSPATQTIERHLSDIDARIAALQTPATQGDSPATQTIEDHVSDIDSRLARLEQRPAVDVGKLMARLDALDGRMADQAQLASRMDTLSGRIESLSGRDQAGLDAGKQQLDALTSRVAAAEDDAKNLAVLSKRLNRIAKLQEASFALASGRPLGDLPNAPEALARYAHNAPPTEAQLRLRFPSAEQAALATKQLDNSDAPFVDRVWDRAQGLITIRRGDDVVIGNPATVILNKAQVALDAGDLPGAVASVERLTGPPGQAVADWLADAKALLTARAALADMADQA